MEDVEILRHAINSLLAEWEKLPRLPSDWKIVSIQDVSHDRYALQIVNFEKIGTIRGCLPALKFEMTKFGF